jgi:peptide methionine sulfoxide reductase msrA/msrB
LRFIPVDQLEKEGYGQFLSLFSASQESPFMPKIPAGTEVATFAGGCFWGVEELVRSLPGVLETDVGYAGGESSTATYEHVKKGNTGHAESIQIVFDPKKIRYEELLGYFFRLHDPTTLNRQGNDVGTQYRSVIFFHSKKQQEIAEAVKKKVNASGKWKNPVVTQIMPARPFYRAEEYHQDYLQKNPGGYTCHYFRD